MSLLCLVEGCTLDEVDGIGGCEHSALSQRITNLSAGPTDAAVLQAIWITLVADQDSEGAGDAWRAPGRSGIIYAKDGPKILADLNNVQTRSNKASIFQTWKERDAGFLIGGGTVAERTIAVNVPELVDTSAIP